MGLQKRDGWKRFFPNFQNIRYSQPHNHPALDTRGFLETVDIQTPSGDSSSQPRGTITAPGPARHLSPPITLSEGPGNFANAHHFIIERLQQVENTVIKVSWNDPLQYFEPLRKSTAELFIRPNRPSCHPHTREGLRDRLNRWLRGEDPTKRVFWIEGPVGVGKSTVAQTIGEQYIEGRESRRRGATFFVSAGDTPYHIIPALAYQLQDQNPEYREVLLQRIKENPSIVKEAIPIHRQFTEFIAKPLAIQRVRDSFQEQRVVIILDGLGQCTDSDTQLELLELIVYHVKENPTPSILWMITTRHESHLKYFPGLVGNDNTCKYEILSVDDEDAKQDVRRLLDHGFKSIANQNTRRVPISVSERWPLETDKEKIANAVGGFFMLASVILDFVRNEKRGDACTRLDDCLQYISNPKVSGPLDYLGDFYRGVLSGVHLSDRVTALRILSLQALYPDGGMCVIDLARFLGLTRGEFYGALEQLHSVIEVPDTSQARARGLRFFHQSFADFLRHHRSELEEVELRLDIATRCIQWYNYVLLRQCRSQAEVCSISFPDLEAVRRAEGVDDPFTPGLETFVRPSCWDACRNIRNEDLPRVISEFRNFDFNHLRLFDADAEGCKELIRWMFDLGPRNEGLIRLSPVCKTDHELLRKYKGDFVDYSPQHEEDYYFISLHHDDGKPQLQTDGRGGYCKTTGVFWLGEGKRSCMVVAYRVVILSGFDGIL